MQNGLKKDIIKYHRYGDHKIKHFTCDRDFCWAALARHKNDLSRKENVIFYGPSRISNVVKPIRYRLYSIGGQNGVDRK